MDLDSAKRSAGAHVDALAAELIALSHEIHAHPELAFEERFASGRLASALRGHGIVVAHPAYDVETAFVAEAGSAGPLVVVCCEYDALPGIGHACAHNVIGTAGLGAGLALAALAQAGAPGRVRILGTPAEEGGAGGKKVLLARGAFAGADVAMMIHPEPANVEYAPYLANDQLIVEMHGRAAHASSAPYKGVNALDALVLGYMGVAALRQHIRPEEKIHGIITDGGKADNIVPDFAAARFRVRGPDSRRLEALKGRVLACFEGAALQTGARLEHRWLGGYAEMVSNRALAAAFRANGERLGRAFLDPATIPASVAGSTDMGDVSKALPSIHPVMDIGTFAAGHTLEFAAAAVTEGADRLVVDGAKALAMTALDVWFRPELLAAMRAEFDARR